MSRFILRAGLGALVVATSLALVAPTAQATPPPTPAPVAPQSRSASSGTTNFAFTTRGNLGQKMTVTAKVLKYGNRKRDHLDWRAAKKYYGAHTTWRDDFAAGFQGAGGTLDNASKSTKSRLRKIWRNSGLNAAKAVPNLGGTNCTGVTKQVPYNNSTKRSEAWYNSCDTNVLVARYTACTIIMGFATGQIKNPWLNVIPPIFAGLCGIDLVRVVLAQSNSSVSAIKYYFTHIYSASGKSAGQYYVEGSIRSQ